MCITRISLDEKIAIGSLLCILRVIPDIARVISGNPCQSGNMHKKHSTAPLNSHAKVVYVTGPAKIGHVGTNYTLSLIFQHQNTSFS